jgi:hypothetical protein
VRGPDPQRCRAERRPDRRGALVGSRSSAEIDSY